MEKELLSGRVGRNKKTCLATPSRIGNIGESVCRLPLETRVQARRQLPLLNMAHPHEAHLSQEGSKSLRMQPVWILEELLSVLCQLSQAWGFLRDK
jgi:hypothetical protein